MEQQFKFTDSIKIDVIGLGYVGLPLAVEFGKQLPTLGFDINTRRIAELRDRFDRTQETTGEELIQAQYLHYTASAEDLRTCNVHIVTAPTPVDIEKCPDFTPLDKAS